MMVSLPLDLSEKLSSIVMQRYALAKANKALIFSPTQMTMINAAGFPFQLRYCPALAKKPTGDEAAKKQGNGKRQNPFEDPSAELLITRVPSKDPSHNLVLNKYPVIPYHFILATQSHKEQTNLLEEDDLLMTHACLKAWEEGEDVRNRRRLYAFFNSGEHSGASQAHRHVQFLPIEEMEGSPQQRLSEQRPWKPLIDFMAGGISEKESRKLPFIHFSSKVPPDSSSSQLLRIYRSLYQQAVTAERNHITDLPNEVVPETGPAVISYSLAMTTSTMAICPRRNGEASFIFAEGGNDDVPCKVTADPGASDIDPPAVNTRIGPIAMNGTILAGTLMVKTEQEWNGLRLEEEKLADMLGYIGVPTNDAQGSRSYNKD